jgi:hypothetical protein
MTEKKQNEPVSKQESASAEYKLAKEVALRAVRRQNFSEETVRKVEKSL